MPVSDPETCDVEAAAKLAKTKGEIRGQDSRRVARNGSKERGFQSVPVGQHPTRHGETGARSVRISRSWMQR